MEATVRLSSKNQIVIPKMVRKKLGIGPGDQLIVDLGEKGIFLRVKPKNYTAHLKGLHREVWEGADTNKYVIRERESWEKG